MTRYAPTATYTYSEYDTISGLARSSSRRRAPGAPTLTRSERRRYHTTPTVAATLATTVVTYRPSKPASVTPAIAATAPTQPITRLTTAPVAPRCAAASVLISITCSISGGMPRNAMAK